ncbi:uncharacterized protein LOC108622404 [Ceratina calcarata]|uniref:Uncharacterized protein LOC108622404 n=1 Tax=Ceratina calcarata TaxID=156304 RepID=A0AAJ7IT32_9HYME|nr:uncharacterized protein LOC108622404 [Ceratina calcarata]
MDAKIFCLLLFVACAYGSFLPSLPSLSSAAKPFTDAIGQGESAISGLLGGKHDKPSHESDDKSSDDSDEKSKKSEEHSKKEEKEVQKLVKQLAHVTEKLLHSANLEDHQTKNLLFSINALVQQLERLAKIGELKERNRRGLEDLVGSALSAFSPSGGKSGKNDKEVEKLTKELQKITEKLIDAVGKDNIQARNILLSLKGLADQLSNSSGLTSKAATDFSGLVDKVPGEISKLVDKAPAEFSGLADKVPGEISKLADKVPGEISKLVDKVPAEIKGLKDRVPRDLSDITGSVSSLLGQNGFSELLNVVPLGSNLTSILSKVDFSKVTEVPKIPSLQDVEKLPVLPGLRENILYARNLTRLALGGIGQSDLPTVIQKATERAIHNIVPVAALTALLSTILHIYYDIAVNSPLYVVGAAVLQDGLVTIAAVVKSVISVVANDIKNIVGSVSG